MYVLQDLTLLKQRLYSGDYHCASHLFCNFPSVPSVILFLFSRELIKYEFFPEATRTDEDIKKYTKYPWGRDIYTLEGEPFAGLEANSLSFTTVN